MSVIDKDPRLLPGNRTARRCAPRRARRQMAQAGRGLGRAPGEVEVGFDAVGQGRRGDDDAMRRPRDPLGERDAGIDPAAGHRDIAFEPVDAVEREPFDGLGPRRLGEVAQQPAPGGELLIGAPLEAADRRVEPLAQPRFGRVVGVFEPARAGSRQGAAAPRQGGRALAPTAAARSTRPSTGGRASACSP